MREGTKKKLEAVGCWSVIVLGFVACIGAMLWCGWAGHKVRIEGKKLRANCEKLGGKTYYRDHGGREGGLVCVLGGREP